VPFGAAVAAAWVGLARALAEGRASVSRLGGEVFDEATPTGWVDAGVDVVVALAEGAGVTSGEGKSLVTGGAAVGSRRASSAWVDAAVVVAPGTIDAACVGSAALGVAVTSDRPRPT
jgi:hypothetical protein